MQTYICQQTGWPYLTWNSKEISFILGNVRNRQGRLTGKSNLLGIDLKKDRLLHSLSQEIIQSAALEGKNLDEYSVNISVSRQLKIGRFKEMLDFDPQIDKIVSVTMDALLNYEQPVTEERIFNWKKLLSQSDSEVYYRNINSGVFLSPITESLYTRNYSFVPFEMRRLLKWINTKQAIDPVIKAGVCYIRFLFIHPFDEHNGQIARSLSDIFIARADDHPQRLFCLSSQILKMKSNYEDILKHLGKKSLDITEWLLWYLYCLEKALIEAEDSLTIILNKSKFWEKYRLIRLNERQIKMINLLWVEGVKRKITTSYWATVNSCSTDTALRDIQDLMDKKILYKRLSGGRSTSYELK